MLSPSLRLKLVRAFVLTAAVPLALSSLLVGRAVFESVRQEVYQRQRETVLVEARRISAFMLEIQRDLEGLGQLIAITSSAGSAAPELRDMLSSFVRSRPVYREISLMDSSGLEVARVSRGGPLPDSALVRRDEEEKFFRAARGQAFYSLVRFADDGPYLSLSVPVPSEGEAPGLKFVVSADIGLSEIWSDIESIRVGQSGYAFLVEERGNLIAYQEPALARSNLSLATWPPVRDVLVHSTSGVVYEYRGLGEQPVVGVGAQVDGPGWVIVIERPAAEAYAPVRQITWVAAGLLAIAILVAGLVGSLLSQRITQPVAVLKEGALRLGSGERSHRIAVRTGDEIEELADEFNRMADSLERSRAQIEAVMAENARLYAEAQQRARDLAAALQQQRELDRLKDQFIQNTSHELRTPLALIRGYVDLLADGDLGQMPDRQREAIAIVQRRVLDLTLLVDSLMAILEAESGAMVRDDVSLSELARQVVSDFEVVADKARIELSVEIQDELPPVQGSARHLRRVLDNLVANAFKFTPGGAVRVRVRGETMGAVSGVRVEVSDTGIGIPADKLGRVFERFYQVNGTAQRRYGGLGLGLALVKQIVEAHEGQVGIDSQAGQGTTVWFWLPGKPAAA